MSRQQRKISANVTFANCKSRTANGDHALAVQTALAIHRSTTLGEKEHVNILVSDEGDHRRFLTFADEGSVRQLPGQITDCFQVTIDGIAFMIMPVTSPTLQTYQAEVFGQAAFCKPIQAHDLERLIYPGTKMIWALHAHYPDAKEYKKTIREYYAEEYAEEHYYRRKNEILEAADKAGDPIQLIKMLLNYTNQSMPPSPLLQQFDDSRRTMVVSLGVSPNRQGLFTRPFTPRTGPGLSHFQHYCRGLIGTRDHGFVYANKNIAARPSSTSSLAVTQYLTLLQSMHGPASFRPVIMICSMDVARAALKSYRDNSHHAENKIAIVEYKPDSTDADIARLSSKLAAFSWFVIVAAQLNKQDFRHSLATAAPFVYVTGACTGTEALVDNKLIYSELLTEFTENLPLYRRDEANIISTIKAQAEISVETRKAAIYLITHLLTTTKPWPKSVEAKIVQIMTDCPAAIDSVKSAIRRIYHGQHQRLQVRFDAFIAAQPAQKHKRNVDSATRGAEGVATKPEPEDTIQNLLKFGKFGSMCEYRRTRSSTDEKCTGKAVLVDTNAASTNDSKRRRQRSPGENRTPIHDKTTTKKTHFTF